MMEKVRIEYQENGQLSKYRDLPKGGFNVRLVIGVKGEGITVEGQTVRTTIETIRKYVQETEGIHVDNQKLFLAGEEVDVHKTFGDYHINNDCTMRVKSFIQVLVSNLETPGPILTEVEVDPRREESVIRMKRKLEFKLGLPSEEICLYLTADEMTTFSRRRALDDTATLKRYLPPSCGGGIIEVRPKTRNIDRENIIVFRVPIKVEETQLARNTIGLHSESVSSQQVAFHHTINTKTTIGWLSLEMDKSQIIKRDPLISDLFTLLKQNNDITKAKPVQSIELRFCKNRTIHGGACLHPDKKSVEDYQIRSEEQMLKVCIDGIETPESHIPPMVPVAKPIHPLPSYEEIGIIYTSPQTPTSMSWNIPSVEELDLGANPSVVMEFSGFSYSRLYGSWDIAEHYKTYVEILIEGTFYVGDNRRYTQIMNDEIIDPSRSAVYYSQEMMEVVITGPENSAIANPQLVNKNPMKWHRNSAESRENKVKFWEETLDRQRVESSPFRYDNRPMNLPERTKVQTDNIRYGHNGPSLLLIDNWYFGKERITQVMPSGPTGARTLFDANCERGLTISGNPNLKVTYTARNLDKDSQDQSTAFDFRIQAQFYICTLENDFDSGTKPRESETFTISVSQKICRTKHVPNRADVKTHVTSPPNSTMRRMLPINIANKPRINATNRA